MTTSRSIRSKSRSSVLPIKKEFPTIRVAMAADLSLTAAPSITLVNTNVTIILPDWTNRMIRFLEEDGEITRFLDHAYEIVDASVKRYMDRGFTI